MHEMIREKALEVGYTDARCATGEPFVLWKERLAGTIYEGMAGAHDPSEVTGWPAEEITLWAAVAPSPRLADWPDGCGEVSGFYLRQKTYNAMYVAWMDAIEGLGFEVKRDVFLPDRAAAIRAGLGVHGLNGLMISPEEGSFCAIAVMAVRAVPPAEARGAAHDLSAGCMMCGACKAFCPTGCISDDGVDAKNCLRAFMNRPQHMTEREYALMGRRILGCEDCQDVCPHNAQVPKAAPSEEFVSQTVLEKLLTQPEIDRYYNYLNNAHVKAQAVLAAANTRRADLLPLIQPLVDSDNEFLARAAKWAVTQLCTK